MDSLSRRILSDPVNKWVFLNSKNETYLVGGYLRDSLLGTASKDKDFVIKHDFQRVAQQVAKKFRGTLVVLKKNQTCRVALKNGELIDFTPLLGTISDNLMKRDFTINAIAWRPESGLIDPLGGNKNLKERIVKDIDQLNLANDPLRILRAYRISAEKGFDIDIITRKHIRKYAAGLRRAASERVTDELFRILNQKDAYKQLKQAYDNSVLKYIFFDNARFLRENLKLLAKYHLFKLKMKNRTLNRYLKVEVGQGLTRNGLINLSILLIGLPSSCDGLKSLKPGNAVKKGVSNIQKVLTFSKKRLTGGNLYSAFVSAGCHVIEAAIVLSLIKNCNNGKILKRADDFVMIKKNNLLSGYDIQKILKIRQGIIVGNIFDALQRSRFLNKIKTKTQAKEWLISHFT